LAVALSPDSQIVLTGTWHTAQLWDAATGKTHGPPLPHPGVVKHVAFSPNGNTFLTGSEDLLQGRWAIQTWDRATLAPAGPLLLHHSRVEAVTFGPGEQTVLTGSKDRAARLWDATTGKLRLAPLPHQEVVHAVAFSRDGRILATGGGSPVSPRGQARLWDVATGKSLGPPLPHNGLVRALAFSPNGKAVLTGSGDNTARLWKVPTPVAGEAERLVLWTQVLTGMELNADSAVRMLDAETWKQRRRRLERH